MARDIVDQFICDPVGTIYDWEDFRPADIRHMLTVLQCAGYARRIPEGRWEKIRMVPRTFDFEASELDYLANKERRRKRVNRKSKQAMPNPVWKAAQSP